MRVSYTAKQTLIAGGLVIGLALLNLEIALANSLSPGAIILLQIPVNIICFFLFLLYLRMIKGKNGEIAVQDELSQKLPRGEYSVLNNFTYGTKGDTDLVVIGPNGVWTIEVKNLKAGDIQYYNDHLCLNGHPINAQRDPLKQAYAEAKGLERYLGQATGTAIPVHAVLVFANRKTTLHFGKKLIRGVHVVGLTWLTRLIQEHERDPRLTLDVQERLTAEVQKYPFDI